MKRGNQGRGGCLEEFEGGANVVKATSAAHRTPVTTPTDGFVGLIGWLTASVSDTTMALAEDGEVLGSKELDMGDSGSKDTRRGDTAGGRRDGSGWFNH